MADLVPGSVTIVRQDSRALSNGITLWTKAASVTLASMGTAANKVLATAFGLSAFEESSAWSKSDNTEVVVAGISNDRSYLLLKAAASGAPFDYSGVYNVYVKGF